VATPALLKLVEVLKPNGNGNGNSRSYVEIKDTVELGLQMKELVRNTATLRALPGILDGMHAEIAEVRNDVNRGSAETREGFAQVRVELEALAFGVQQTKERVG
jgi:hypothetical protein